VKPASDASNRLSHLFLLGPALILFGISFIVPMVGAMILSFTDFDIYALADIRNVQFIGLKNYRSVLSAPLFWQAVRNTVLFVVLAGPLSILVSFTVAVLLNSRLTRMRGLFRTILFAPVVTTVVAISIVWRYLLDARLGLLNHALRSIGFSPIDWLGSPSAAIPALVIMTVWKSFGYNMVIFLAGLQNIPTSMLEAAEIDGAGSWRRLLDVTIPSLVPTFLFVFVTTAIGYGQLFAEPYVMTEGGPLHSTYSVVMMMHEEGFRWWSLGYAAAIAFTSFAGIVLASVLVRFVWRKSQS
jgi:multiple sugar transport system permease protein